MSYGYAHSPELKPNVGDGQTRWDPEGIVRLPHMCDDWVIGDAEDVRALIADLQALLDSGQVREDVSDRDPYDNYEAPS